LNSLFQVALHLPSETGEDGAGAWEARAGAAEGLATTVAAEAGRLAETVEADADALAKTVAVEAGRLEAAAAAAVVRAGAAEEKAGEWKAEAARLAAEFEEEAAAAVERAAEKEVEAGKQAQNLTSLTQRAAEFEAAAAAAVEKVGAAERKAGEWEVEAGRLTASFDHQTAEFEEKAGRLAGEFEEKVEALRLELQVCQPNFPRPTHKHRHIKCAISYVPCKPNPGHRRWMATRCRRQSRSCAATYRSSLAPQLSLPISGRGD